MPKFPFVIGGASVALLTAGALLLWQLADAAPPAAATSHAMMGHGTPAPTVRKVMAAANEVVIDDFHFGPTELTVPVGTKVMWTNDDPDPHTVTSEADPKLLKSPPLDTGDSFAFTFDKPGTYRYFCSIHPRMQGTIVVQ
ncbi:MAG TPA: cupredoxin family copper-binding protein [Stellaceae bacterium]|nr:cupredoxin family copper-binding protein [Stellaceae bacterium]